MEFLAIFGLIIIFAFALTALILYGIWKIPKIGKISCVVVGGFITFSVVTAIWPMDSFYLEELQINSQLTLSKPFKVLSKKSSYPDFHGDYFSEAIFQVTKLDLSGLARDLKSSEKCPVPELAKPYLEEDHGSISCWDANRNGDEWFTLTYFREIGILHYRFDQT